MNEKINRYCVTGFPQPSKYKIAEKRLANKIEVMDKQGDNKKKET